ncbi:hypothetical protein ACU4GI_33045 [Cupriavidus basilensis]
MTEAELRAIYDRRPSPEMRRLLWEIARLHSVVRRAAQFATCFPLYDGQTTSSAYHIILGALRRELAGETWLASEAAASEEIFDTERQRLGRTRG